jgi:5-methylcytosine-specific restriction protein A
VSTERIMPRTRLTRDQDGNPLCRWCGRPVKPPRRTFCSAECVHEYRVRRDPGYVRQQLQKRDKGVCAICGVDTAEAARAIQDLLTESKRTNPAAYYDHRCAWAVWRYEQGIANRSTLWEADHIVPVVEGGGACGLENYRTLCIWCHKRETAKLARRLAKARRTQQELPLIEEA